MTVTDKLVAKINDLIENHTNIVQALIAIIGFLMLALGIALSKEKNDEWLKAIGSFCEQCGGCFTSIAVVTFFYEKWRDKKISENKQYYIMNPNTAVTGQKLNELINIDKKNGKFLIIGRITEDDVHNQYGFPKLLTPPKLLNKEYPLLSYGTTFRFLSISNTEYYNAIKAAITNGLGLRVSIINPNSRAFVQVGKEDTIQLSNRTISDFLQLINTLIQEKKDKQIRPIELRLSSYYSPCSFSSLSFLNGRIVRSLEFNFRHEKDGEIAQVFDHRQIISNHGEDNNQEHGKFSNYLFNRYSRLYRESALAFRFPMADITYYVLGVLTDINETEQNGIISKELNRYIILDNKEQLFKITVHLDTSNNQAEWQVLRNGRCISHNPEHITKLFGRANETRLKNNNNEPLHLAETILGKVLYDYYLQTGGTEEESNNQNNGYKLEITSSFDIIDDNSFEVKSDVKDNNKFVLIGSITGTPLIEDKRTITLKPISEIENGVGFDGFLTQMLSIDNSKYSDVLEKIKASIKLS